MLEEDNNWDIAPSVLKAYALGELSDEKQLEIENIIETNEVYQDIVKGFLQLKKEMPNTNELDTYLNSAQKRAAEQLNISELVEDRPKPFEQIITYSLEQLREWFIPFLVEKRFKMNYAGFGNLAFTSPIMDGQYDDFIPFELEEEIEDELELSLYDSQDKRVYFNTIAANTKKLNIDIQSSELHPGVYLLELINPEYGDVNKCIIYIQKDLAPNKEF